MNAPRIDAEEAKNGTLHNHKHGLIKSDSISASKCVSVKANEVCFS